MRPGQKCPAPTKNRSPSCDGCGKSANSRAELRDGWSRCETGENRVMLKHVPLVISAYAKWFETSVEIADENLALSHELGWEPGCRTAEFHVK